MPEFIRHRERIEETRYELFYSYEGHDGLWGFGFDCDKNGNVDLRQFDGRDRARESYDGCLKGEIGGRKITRPYVKKIENSFWKPAAIRCSCGVEIELWDPMTNGCDCGREYNSSGQLLASRECWGEETGEHPTDIENWRNYREDQDY